MKIKKLNEEILKRYYKDNKLYVEKFDDKIFISDSYCVWIINSEDFIFDINKFKAVRIFSLVNGVMDKQLLDGLLTNEYTKEGKITYRYIVHEDNKVIIDEQHLKCFNDDCNFKIVDNHTPVLVYENEQLVGMICPIKRF